MDSYLKFPFKDTYEFSEFILNKNLNIENNIFLYTKFEDNAFENNYKNKVDILKSINYFGDFILIFGNLVSIIYIFLYINLFELRLLYSVNFLLSIVFFILKFCKNFKKASVVIDHINVFLVSLAFFIKLFLILNLQENLTKETIRGELIRMIIYEFILNGIIIILKFEASFILYTFYYLVNFTIIFLTIYYENWNPYYIFEAIISFCFYYIMFSFRKYFEFLSRSYFAEKYKVERLNNYAFNFIEGLKNNHIVLHKDKIIFINKEFSNYLEKEVLNILPFNNNEISYINSDVNISTLNINNKSNFKLILKELVRYNENFLINSNNNIYNKYGEEDNLWNAIIGFRNKNVINTNEFIKLGTFQFKNSSINKFYNVIIRQYKSLDNKSFEDIIFYDVSDLLSMRKKIYEDNLIKEKILAKMAHELKHL
jgi:hypothetical protein